MAQVQCSGNYNNLYSQLSRAERDLLLVEFKLYPIFINLSCTLFILFFVCASGSHHIFVDLKIWVSSCFQCHCLICLNTLVYSCLVWALLSLHSVKLLLGAASTAALFQNINCHKVIQHFWHSPSYISKILTVVSAPLEDFHFQFYHHSQDKRFQNLIAGWKWTHLNFQKETCDNRLTNIIKSTNKTFDTFGLGKGIQRAPCTSRASVIFWVPCTSVYCISDSHQALQ